MIASNTAASPPLALGRRASALALLLLEGGSTGLGAFWATHRSLLARAGSNDLDEPLRRRIALFVAGGALLAAVAGLALARARRPSGVSIEDVARRVAPLALVGLLPVLLAHGVWKSRDLAFLGLASAASVGASWAFATSATARPCTPLGPYAATALGAIGGAWRRRLSAMAPTIVVVAAALAYAAYFSVVTVLHHRNLGTSSLDLGLEDNLVWNTLHGGPIFKSSPLSGPTGTHFGHHATFLAFLLALPYAAYPHAETLLVLQAALVGAAAIPLFLYARRRIAPWSAAMVSVAYLLQPAVHGANLYDFHYLTLAPIFVWTTLLALDAGRPVLTALAVALTLSVREDVSLHVLLVGVFVLLQGRRPRAGLVVACVAAAYFVVMKFLVMPRYHHGEESFVHHYQEFLTNGAKGFGGILLTVVANPGFVATRVFEQDKLVYVLQLAMPLAFLPFANARRLWLFALWALFTLLASSKYPALYQISFQYTAHWTTVAFPVVVAVLAERRGASAEGPKLERGAVAALLFSTLIGSHQYGAVLQRETARGGFGAVAIGTTTAEQERYRDLRALVALFPADAKVVASERLVPHVSNRVDAYTLRFGAFDAEWLLCSGPVLGAEVATVRRLLDQGFGLVERRGSLILARRGYRQGNGALRAALGNP